MYPLLFGKLQPIIRRKLILNMSYSLCVWECLRVSVVLVCACIYVRVCVLIWVWLGWDNFWSQINTTPRWTYNASKQNYTNALMNNNRFNWTTWWSADLFSENELHEYLKTILYIKMAKLYFISEFNTLFN